MKQQKKLDLQQSPTTGSESSHPLANQEEIQDLSQAEATATVNTMERKQVTPKGINRLHF
jgi:hypothetical protein